MRWACSGDIERGSMSHLHCSGDTHTGPGSGSRYLTFPTRASSQWAGGWAGARASSVLTSTSDTQITDRYQAENIRGKLYFVSSVWNLECSSGIFRPVLLIIRDHTSLKIIEIEFRHNHRNHLTDFVDSEILPV